MTAAAGGERVLGRTSLRVSRLGLGLAAALQAPVPATTFGVFRM